MNKAAYIVSFICGAAFGAVVMSIYKNKKSETAESTETADPFEPVEEQTDISEEEPTEEPVIIPEVKSDIEKTVSDIIVKNGYSIGDHTNPDVDDGPYVIGPADFGEFEDYDALSLTLLSDGILVDDRMYTIDDPENTVGTNYKKYFGVYPNDPDTVYIRNDELCCDYEIVKDLRTYEEVDAQRPHLRWSD